MCVYMVFDIGAKYMYVNLDHEPADGKKYHRGVHGQSMYSDPDDIFQVCTWNFQV